MKATKPDQPIEQKYRRLLSQSHERQFKGQDWQGVAIDLLPDAVEEPEREELFDLLCTSPFPGCECGFCGKADWSD